MGERVEVQTLEGSGNFSGYLATPAGGAKGPGILVIQEIFGVNAGIRQMCDDWAAQGYVAFAPDLFWRISPNVELSDKTEAEWQRAFGFFQKFDVDAGVRDIEASIRFLRSRPECAGKVGAVGYCLGGKLAYLTATRTDVDASVGYYGVGLDALLGESHAIARPLMLHIAQEDKFVDKAAQKKIHEGLDTHPRVTLHDYAGVDHAFARVDGVTRDEAAADLADSRTRDFFAEHLRG